MVCAHIHANIFMCFLPQRQRMWSKMHMDDTEVYALSLERVMTGDLRD